MRLFAGILLISIAIPAGAPAEEPVDRVVAVVGETPVLDSEVLAEMEIYAADPSLRGTPSPEIRALALRKLVEDRILIAKAEEDGIAPSDEEVEEALGSSIERMRSQFPGEEEFLAALAAENLTLGELRDRYLREVERTLTVRMLVEQRVRGKLDLTEADLKRFYEEHREELPVLPERYSLAQIYFEPSAAAEAGAAATGELQELRERALAGEDFEALAREHSDGPSAPNGGDLGFFGPGDMDPVFEAAAFALGEPGDVSEIVRTRFGYHLIQLVDRSGGRIRARHILKTLEAGSEGWEEARIRAEAIADSLAAGARFARLARTYSDDPGSASRGGEVGVFAVSDMTDDVRQVLSALAPGENSGAVEASDGYHVFKLIERYPEGKPTLAEAREEIRRAARQSRQQELIREYLDELRREIYVEILEEKRPAG
ncbi:MAG: peptidylprolyl isomerase [Candidatus Eisenbacteria bacterium]